MQEQVIQKKGRGLKLSDLLVTILISIVLGVVYHFWGSVYNLFSPLFPQADEIVYGMWFLAPTLVFLLIRKPGVALIAEIAAAHVAILFGSEWGIQLVMYGVLQGLGAELVFAAFRYRKFSGAVAALAGIGAAVGSLIPDIYYGYVADYETWLLIAKYAMRALSSAVIAGYLAFALAKAVEATGVTNLLRPVADKDYAALND
ncbi:energy-coupling factor transport system substrate-specific component [Paenibacillus anaericanus]|uniref:Thiamine ABC transporter permease n=1 Tax=Paenibacillus anaericanus TaxID=170367 RepID=A0A3S1DNS8_9BACL|nr:ECF transporter S component [Paenibacillus anaericanus]MDQ0090781.1 energy-coupling factor transport system substrate-specific component [Paenibacillus anaericanus]RUT48642.1 thiamine ABC transporter permease [Paenibacillus anaericanus]